MRCRSTPLYSFSLDRTGAQEDTQTQTHTCTHTHTSITIRVRLTPSYIAVHAVFLSPVSPPHRTSSPQQYCGHTPFVSYEDRYEYLLCECTVYAWVIFHSLPYAIMRTRAFSSATLPQDQQHQQQRKPISVQMSPAATQSTAAFRLSQNTNSSSERMIAILSPS